MQTSLAVPASRCNEQRNVALQAVGQAFTTTDDDKVMFYFPISKKTICTIVILLHLTCRSTYRHIIEFLRDLVGIDISIGSVSNIINGAAITAGEINKREELSSVKIASSDEVFHRNQPIMATVDIPSRYCLQADLCDSRDGESWAINLLFMKDLGYNPDSVIVDSAKGMTKGYADALPNTKLQYDHFHIINDMNEVSRSLRNNAQSKLSLVVKLEGQLERAKDELRILTLTERYDDAVREFVLVSKVSQQFATLNNWLQHDVLQLAGYDHKTRTELYDFILEELATIVKTYQQRSTKKTLKSLRFQRDKLLDVANVLHTKFVELAKQRSVSLATVWRVCYLTRYNFDSIKYQSLSGVLEVELTPELYDSLEDDVLAILETTHRCSSIIENFNSRLTTFVQTNKTITQKTLNIYRFFLNHNRFMRSKHEYLQGKSPAEILTGKKHEVWYEMLGFQKPKLIAA